MAVTRQAQGSQHVQIKHGTSSPRTPKPQGFEQLFSPLQTPVLSTWNWGWQWGRQRPWRAPSPGRWGCRTSSGARHRRHRAAPGPVQEWQDGWQPGHRGREPSEPQLWDSFPREKARGQLSQRQWQGPTTWLCFLQQNKNFRKILWHRFPPPPRNSSFPE